MLRNRLPDKIAEWPDPKRGINLRKSPEDLLPDEAYLLMNAHWDGGLRKRTGSSLFSTPSLGMLEATGGTLFSYSNNSAVRLVAGSTNLWSIANSGAMLSTLTSTLTAGTALHFRTWPITDRVYLANGTDAIRYYDGSELSTISGTNVPASPTMICPFSDRLFAIQGGVVVSSNARSDSVWSTTGSSWSTYRPFASGAWPTAIHLHTATGELGDPAGYLLIFQRNAVYGLRGTDFGDNVSGGSPSTGWDAELILFDPRIGTSSPYTIVTVPGLGTFWLTTERNIAWLPFGSTNPRLIGDALITTNRTDVLGLNLIDSVNLDQSIMVYHDRKLKLMIPESGNAFCTIAYWMDLRPLHENLGAILRGDADEGEAVAWSGPHTIQPVKRAWVEQETGDLERLMALGGRATSYGLYVYELNPYEVYTEAIATTSSNEYIYDWKSFYNHAGQPTMRKYLPRVLLDAGGFIQYATVSVTDLHGTLTSGFAPLTLAGLSFDSITYGNSIRYGNGIRYGQNSVNQLGEVAFDERSDIVPTGDALQIRVQAGIKKFILRRCSGRMSVERFEPVD